MKSKRRVRGVLCGCVCGALLLSAAAAAQTESTVPDPRTPWTLTNPAGTIGIVRHPAPANWKRGALDQLPRFDPTSRRQWQVDLRGYDVSALDLTNRLEDLQHAEFDSKTGWPDKLPAGFEPQALIERNKDPGLGVRKLHARGITGRGVSIGIIDQTLLVDHQEYADRIRFYEENHLYEANQATMHGAAVTSIAAGKTVGVAPGAEVYYIAESHGTLTFEGRPEMDFTYLAQAIDRLLEVNRSLPAEKRIRVISASIGWMPNAKGYAEITAAVERAKAAGVFVVSSSLQPTFGFAFQGLGRDPQADPNDPAVHRPGSFWAPNFWNGGFRFKPGEKLLVPMDSRATASPGGSQDYVFYPTGGWSWSIPWIAGLYALACQAKPDVTPQEFWAAALATGKTITVTQGGTSLEFGTIADPVALIERLQGSSQ